MKKLRVLAAFALLLALVPAVLAGGWAVITLDEAPGEIRAGEPWMVGFTVLQHGVTPVHDLGKDLPIEPKLTATNAATGERVEAFARPTKELGHFAVEVTFPGEGEWEWTIAPAPLMGETQFEALTVLGAVPFASQANTPLFSVESFPSALRWIALLVGLAAVALFAIHYHRREPARSEAK